MKKLLLFLAGLVTLVASAQTSLTVKLKDGKDYSAYISNIDSVVFTNDHPTQFTVINTIKVDTIIKTDTLVVRDTVIRDIAVLVHDTIYVPATIQDTAAHQVPVDTTYNQPVAQELQEDSTHMTPRDHDKLTDLVSNPWIYNSTIPENPEWTTLCWQNTQTGKGAMTDIDAYQSAYHAATRLLEAFESGTEVSKLSFSSAYNNLLTRTQALTPCVQ